MDDTLEPGEVRSREFEVVRRGYDKKQVERFREEAAVTIAALTTELGQLKEQLDRAGMADVPDLKSELEAVSSQVAEILEAARTAAEGMRSRASEDAARWRAEADKESRALRAASTKDAEQARGSAWEEGTRLLEQAEAESTRLLEEAHQAALFIRAEAEREALRLTGNARRDREEALRGAKKEADRLLIDARAESDRILENARQSAQAAQERAQALERRRRELMQELESARLSIGQLEQEIDSRRAALHMAAEAPDSGVRVIQTEEEQPAEWPDDDASVRIVPASHVAPDEPVDPDEFVAEVELLQARIAAAVETPGGQGSGGREVESPAREEASGGREVEAAEEQGEAIEHVETVDPYPAAPDHQMETGELEEAEKLEAAEEPPSVVAADEEASEPDAGRRGDAEEAPAAPVTASGSIVAEEIDELFARLRHEDAPAADEPASRGLPGAGDVPEAPIPEAAAAPVATVTIDREVATVTPVAALDLAADPFELRDRVLLPIENRTLRSVKRRIVDLQNRVLEEIRVADDWEPDRSMFVAAVSDDIARLNQESFVAGYAAAAELLDETTTPPPDRGADQATSGDFVDSLLTDAVHALTHALRSGGGSRQVSAAVGRVFRAWRTDEAERRLRRASRLAYNEGLLGAYPELGVERVIALAPGNPCGDCPAGTDASWRPGGPLPPATKLPPAGPGCRATIVPAG